MFNTLNHINTFSDETFLYMLLYIYMFEMLTEAPTLYLQKAFLSSVESNLLLLCFLPLHYKARRLVLTSRTTF